MHSATIISERDALEELLARQKLRGYIDPIVPTIERFTSSYRFIEEKVNSKKIEPKVLTQTCEKLLNIYCSHDPEPFSRLFSPDADTRLNYQFKAMIMIALILQKGDLVEDKKCELWGQFEQIKAKLPFELGCGIEDYFEKNLNLQKPNSISSSRTASVFRDAAGTTWVELKELKRDGERHPPSADHC